MIEIQKPDWSPLLETGDLRISLYAGENGTGETIEIRDGQTIYIHMNEIETSAFLKWIDGRDRDVNPKWQPIASRESVALLRLLTSASLMRLAIKERATFLTKTTDWERLEDAMRSAELVLGDYTKNPKGLRASQPQWQPIETAPKDGSEVFAWGPRWKRPDYIHFRNGKWCEWVGLDTGEWEPITFSESFLPTHWMPLPDPPAFAEHLARQIWGALTVVNKKVS